MQPFIPLADPEKVRAQIVSVFDTLGPPVLVALIERLRSGTFDGSSTKYDFLATIAEPIGTMPEVVAKRLNFHVSGKLEPIECFTFNIAPGHTPDNNDRARTLSSWCAELLKTQPENVS